MATASARQIETALLTEHLRYTPLTLLDDIINTINELIARAVDAAEEGLLAADPAVLGFAAKYAAENRIPDTDNEGRPVYEGVKEEVEEGVHKLETLLESNVDRNFDKLEIYILRNVLSVPGDLVPWVKLKHYEGLNLEPRQQREPRTVEGVQRLRRKVQETKKLNGLLNRAIERNERMLQDLRSMLTLPATVKREQSLSSEAQTKTQGKDEGMTGAYAFLTHTPAAQALGLNAALQNSTTTTTPGLVKANSLSTNTEFALAQLPALKTLLSELRPKIEAMSHDTKIDIKEGETQRERRLYVESQTRKVLERRGISIEEGGVMDPLGRRVGSEELKALEGIVDELTRGNSHVGESVDSSTSSPRTESRR
jgi:kinetochore protein Mis12/MTW1